MEIFMKAVAAVLITAVFCLVLSKQGKDYSVLLAIVVSCMVFSAAITYLKPVFDLVQRLSELGQINSQMLSILLKSVGIALLAEVTELVCKDTGNSTLGKAIQILTVAVILWLSIPLLHELLDLMESIFSST